MFPSSLHPGWWWWSCMVEYITTQVLKPEARVSRPKEDEGQKGG